MLRVLLRRWGAPALSRFRNITPLLEPSASHMSAQGSARLRAVESVDFGLMGSSVHRCAAVKESRAFIMATCLHAEASRHLDI